jgi:hypothetical protein
MRRILPVWIAVVLSVTAWTAKAETRVTVSSDGWTISAVGDESLLSVAHDGLGTVVKNVRLNLRSQRGLLPLKNWSVEKTGEHQLSIRTIQPSTGWRFEMGGNTLKISSTSTSAVLTAAAPAPRDRVVARLLDPQGTPVDWVGTNEVASSYGGSETRNPSFLPARNPECMYFALGRVSASNLHSLFDLQTDTAIGFPNQTVMERNSEDQEQLDLTLPVPGNAVIGIYPDYFKKALGVPFYVRYDDSYFSHAPAVWSSWTSYYGGVREEDIIRNTDWIAQNLKPYGFEYVQLDDGYDRGKNGEHDWIENWDRTKFPHGPQWLTSYIKSKGLLAGLWLVPNAYAGAVEEHPDWYVRDPVGKTILDYRTPALDSTHPEVLAFVRKLFTTLDDWGFDYYKFDGEHALPQYVPRLDRQRLYNKSVDPIVAYRNRLQLIRETLGPKRFIEGCPAGTPLNGIGFFNSYFTGHDVYNSWQGMYALFSSISANAFLNHILVYVMPGEGIDVGPPMSIAEAEKKRYPEFVQVARTREEPLAGFGTTLAEARTLVTFIALTGVVYPLASVLPELPEERVNLLKATLPTMPILPVDLFSRGTDMQWNIFKHTQQDYYIHNYPEILDLKVNANSGVYDVVGLTNWRNETVTRDIDFTGKLGLSGCAPYVVFDFWGQKLLGVFRDRMELQVEPHDTRVLLIHKLLNRPQLVGISRHITGAYSILDLTWDGSSELHGRSQSVPGDPYKLWAYVPEGTTVSQVRAMAGNRSLPVDHVSVGNSLSVSFSGQQEVVDWQIRFTTR